MKKVIGVALAASLVAGMAFADVAVTLNNNVRTNMYHQTKSTTTDLDAGTKTDKKDTYIFDLNGASGHGGTADGQKGELVVSGKNDYASVELKIKASNKDNVLGLDGVYDASLKFGGLNLTFGTFDSRHVNRYSTTAGESGLLDSDNTKYGTSLLNSFKYVVTTNQNKKKEITLSTSLLKDANNASTLAGSRSVSVLADYTFNDVAGGNVLVKAGLLTNDYSQTDAKKSDGTDETTMKYQKAGYVGELDFDNDAVKLQAIVKVPNEKQKVFGIFAEPTIAKEIPLAFGFSYGTDSDDDGKYSKTTWEDDDTDKTTRTQKVGKYTAMAFDARIGYVINDQAKISTTVNYETVDSDLADAKVSALALAGELSYIVNDLATVFGDVGYYNYNLGGEDKFAKVAKVSVRPGVVLNAGAGARVTAAFHYDSYSGDNKTIKNEWSIPVFFKVQL